MKCKNCGRVIPEDESRYTITTTVGFRGADHGIAKERSFEAVYCVECGQPEADAIKRAHI